ncbi:hypothetical protein [Streptomyces sp. NPDC094437]|uniref:hypothetical protein n=1 Tax=Streptomyces sp. NPDC094437 TaxID=3366060 RepID=UPI0038250A7D
MTPPQNPASTAWKPLREEEEEEAGAPLVLAVDFAGSGRPESTFAALSPLLAPGVTLWETRQPDPELARTFDGEDFVRFWAQAVRATGRPVHAVLGYCVGGLYAARLAQLLSEGQDTPPRVVLFDPELPDVAGMTADFHAAVARLSSVLTPQEHALADRVADEAARDFTTVAAFGAALTKSFAEIAHTAFARAGLLTELADELTLTYEAFVSYIAAASAYDPAELWPNATAVTSPTADPNARHAGHRVPVEVAHEDILRSRTTADTVNALLI